MDWGSLAELVGRVCLLGESVCLECMLALYVYSLYCAGLTVSLSCVLRSGRRGSGVLLGIV